MRTISNFQMQYNNTPLRIGVNYIDTQFTFKFKLPSNKYVIIHEGNNTKSKVTGEDTTVITYETNYTKPGLNWFFIEGDVLSITSIDIRFQSIAQMDLSSLGRITSLLDILATFSAVTGSIDSLGNVRGFKQLLIFNTDITGDVATFEGIDFDGLAVNGTNVYGDISKLYSAMSSTGTAAGETDVTYDTQTPWDHSNGNFLCPDCGWTPGMVDNCLIALSAGGTAGVTITINGTNAARTSASDAAKATLEGNGCTVNVNE